IEEAEHLRWPHHPRDAHAGREQRARDRGDDVGHEPLTIAPVIVAVATPTPKNTIVAMIDRFDSRDIPHRPWPLVQPFDIRVPRPTHAPAIATSHSGTRAPASNVSGAASSNTAPAASAPARNHTRQVRSP